MDVVSALDKHAGAVQAVATLVLIGITAWYAFLTRAISRSARESQRPYVFIDVRSEGGTVIEFIIGNDGGRAAQDLSLSLDHLRSAQLDEQFRALPPFRSGISYLAPGRRYRYMIIVSDQTAFDVDAVEHVILATHIGYRDDQRKFSERFSLDLTALSGVLVSSFSEPGEAIASQLRELVQQGSRREFHSRPMMLSAPEWCPICKSKIPTGARKCPECLEWLPDADPVIASPAEADSAEEPGRAESN